MLELILLLCLTMGSVDQPAVQTDPPTDIVITDDDEPMNNDVQ